MDILEKEIGVNDFLASQLDAKMAQLDLLEPPNSENGPQIVGNLDAVDFSDMPEFHPTGIKPFELNPRVPYLQTLYNREREASYRVQVLGALIRGDALEPKTYRQARNCPDSIKWDTAEKKELASLEENGTWELVLRTDEMNVITGKWVYKLKRDSNNEVIRHKARWCARGFTQEYGIDFEETFAGVAKSMAIKVLFALAAQYDLEIDQMDVETAFLNGEIDADVYVEQPTGYGDSKYVCKLKRGLYGLKQSPRLWQEKLRKALNKFGYYALDADSCIYRNPSTGVILSTYVDDFLIFGKNRAEIETLKEYLNTQFKMKDEGPCVWFCGIRVVRDRPNRKIHLVQDAYIDKVLRQFGMENCKPKANPMDPGSLDSMVNNTEKATEDDIKQYQSVIGSLMYAMIQTRPDLAFTVSVLSRFAANPSRAHIRAAYKTLQYLKGTKYLGITFTGTKHGRLDVKIYSDSDFAGCKETRRSTGGYLVMMAGAPVSWKSKRQKCVTHSTMEAEYYALSEAAREAAFIRMLLKSLSYNKGDVTPCKIFGDNIPSILLSKNPEFHERAKHIEVKYHYCREQYLEGNISITHIPTKENVSDLLTKPLLTSTHQTLVKLMGMDARVGVIEQEEIEVD